MERQGLARPPGGLHQVTEVEVRSGEMLLIVGNAGVRRCEITPRRDRLVKRFVGEASFP